MNFRTGKLKLLTIAVLSGGLFLASSPSGKGDTNAFWQFLSSPRLTTASFDAGAGEPGNGLAVQNPLAGLKSDELTAILDRPLFSPSRRPARLPDTSSAKIAKTPTPGISDFRLLGVLSGGRRPIALVKIISKKRHLRLEVGDAVGTWRVTRVDSHAVALAQGAKTAILQLKQR